jgi:two-component system cell cycle response regulator
VNEPQKILVVDDDKFNAALMREICENAGYTVVEANDGDQVLEMAAEHEPDLILLDIMMSTKDGFQVCKELRANEVTADTPIILVTAVDDLDAKVRGIELGADDYVTKPFRLFDLQTRIRSALDIRSYQRERADGDLPTPEKTASKPFRVGGYRQLRWDLEYEFNRAVRYGHPLSCALLVINRFEEFYTDQKKKEAAGLIAAVVTVLQGTLRSVDRIYRIEDDVFIVVMPETDAEQARVPVGRIRDGLKAKDASSTGPVSLTASLVAAPDPSLHSERDILRQLTDLLREVRPEEKDQLIEKVPKN